LRRTATGVQGPFATGGREECRISGLWLASRKVTGF
jgi:hypothetical protein